MYFSVLFLANLPQAQCIIMKCIIDFFRFRSSVILGSKKCKLTTLYNLNYFCEWVCVNDSTNHCAIIKSLKTFDCTTAVLDMYSVFQKK